MPLAPPLSIYEFGRRLVLTGDLDPVYVAVYHSGLRKDVLKRWLIAYWCFYHAGTASWVVSGQGESDFWRRVKDAAATKDHPRCPERRHFRGGQAVRSAAYLAGRGVDDLLDPILRVTGTQSAAAVMQEVQTWVGFGGWIAFKAADMVERLGLAGVRFGLAAAMYEAPVQGARLLWERERPGEPPPDDGLEVAGWAVERLLSSRKLSGLMAPPLGDRPLGYQECETVLCKWKSHVSGRYHVGEDVAALRKAITLDQYSKLSCSRALLSGGEKGGLW